MGPPVATTTTVVWVGTRLTGPVARVLQVGRTRRVSATGFAHFHKMGGGNAQKSAMARKKNEEKKVGVCAGPVLPLCERAVPYRWSMVQYLTTWSHLSSSPARPIVVYPASFAF